MNLQAYLQQSYAADKAAIDADYETLMAQEEQQHRQRMDAYAKLRTASITRLKDKYGAGFEPITATVEA